MITFCKKSELPKSNKKIMIDFQDCSSKENAILCVSQKLKGRESPSLVSGRSFDALFDVVCDFFNENWMNWHDIHIYNWSEFSRKNPILSQQILTLIIEAYLASISSEIQMMIWEETNTSIHQLLEAIRDKKPNIYILLN